MTADALVGTPVGAGTVNSDPSRFSPALFSTAPYKPPKTAAQKAREQEPSPEKLCSIEGCRAYRISDHDTCVAHSQTPRPKSKGRCAREGCRSYAKYGTDFCRWHGA